MLGGISRPQAIAVLTIAHLPVLVMTIPTNRPVAVVRRPTLARRLPRSRNSQAPTPSLRRIIRLVMGYSSVRNRPAVMPNPNLTSPQLATAAAHPTRVHVLAILNDRNASPRELAAELREPLNNVSYHVDVLRRLGCIELVETRPAANGRVVEHVYRAIERSYFDDEAWNELGEKEKQIVATSLVRLISEDINRAIARGTFFESDDNHISRTPMTVDEQGWLEVVGVLDRTLGELLDIKERADERRVSGSTTIPTKVEIIHFKSPAP